MELHEQKVIKTEKTVRWLSKTNTHYLEDSHTFNPNRADKFSTVIQNWKLLRHASF